VGSGCCRRWRGCAWITRTTFRYSLRRRAYTKAEFEQLVKQAQFASAEIREIGCGMDIRLHRRLYLGAGAGQPLVQVKVEAGRGIAFGQAVGLGVAQVMPK